MCVRIKYDSFSIADCHSNGVWALHQDTGVHLVVVEVFLKVRSQLLSSLFTVTKATVLSSDWSQVHSRPQLKDMVHGKQAELGGIPVVQRIAQAHGGNELGAGLIAGLLP